MSDKKINKEDLYEKARQNIRKLLMGEVRERDVLPAIKPFAICSPLHEGGGVDSKEGILSTFAQLLVLSLCLACILLGCGGSGSSEEKIMVATTDYASLNFASISSKSPIPNQDCSLIGPRHNSQGPGSGSSKWEGTDLWNWNADCTFESFSCGNVGYVISDDWLTTQNANLAGIIEFEVTDRFKTPTSNRYCFEQGKYRCQYQMDKFHFLDFTMYCQKGD